jgi:hypothetical protein
MVLVMMIYEINNEFIMIAGQKLEAKLITPFSNKYGKSENSIYCNRIICFEFNVSTFF